MQDHLLLEYAQTAVAEYRERTHVSPYHPLSKDTYCTVFDGAKRLDLTIEATPSTFDVELRLLVDGQETQILLTAFDNGQSQAAVLASGQIAGHIPEIAELLLVLSRGEEHLPTMPILALQEVA